jgi:hypothetical protein
MKKVSLLVLLAIVASTLLMAAIPTTIVRLTIINKSGYDVYMKLEGSSVTEAFYYLTVPAGDRDVPTVKVFTIMSDLYKRTTWQCNGAQSSGTLIVDGNIRLTFTPCGEKACTWSVDRTYLWGCFADDLSAYTVTTTHRYAGEPRMEKVTYFRYLSYGDPSWTDAYLYQGFWNFGCGTWYYRLRTYRLPYGCAWRYQY